MEIIWLIIGILFGGVTGYFIGNLLNKSKDHTEILPLQSQVNELERAKSVLEERLKNSIEKFQLQEKQIEAEREENTKLIASLAESNAKVGYLNEKLNQQADELNNIQEKFTKEFENIAHKLLKQNSTDFASSNQKKLDEILNPFKDKIDNFEKRIGEAFNQEMRDKISLKEEVKNLYNLNQKINKEAENLARALKGDQKLQGNWGEMILERILENSGLTKGSEYVTQHSTTNEEGRRLQPDVIIHLPDKKHIVVDSKVSLVAYEGYINADSEESKQASLNSHLISIKSHIKKLGEKEYQQGFGINSPDFVLLFIPIESCFSLALQADQNLYSYAWDRKIVMVSPSTLLATLRTIASVWKQEKQTKNALEIARQAGKLHEKFVNFLQDMDQIDKSIEKAKQTYSEAYSKLASGRGNLVRSTEKIRKLGAKTSKTIPEKFRQDHLIEEQNENEN